MCLCLDGDDMIMKDRKLYFIFFLDIEFKRIKLFEINELK